MYTDYFKLKSRPFQLTPDYHFFFNASPHKKAVDFLNYGISQGEGFIVITGDIGAGKTTLVDYILSTLIGRNIVAAKVASTLLDADNMLRMVAEAFDLSQDRRAKATVLKRVETFLMDSYRSGKRVLLFVDEAQNLPQNALEELRMLSNIHVEGHPVMQTFLLGQPEFRRTLASKDLEQLRQRVITTFHLSPMEEEETRMYIEHRLHKVGWNEDPEFTDEAFQLIYEATGGVPRKINLVCDRVLLSTFLEEQHTIDRQIVHEVVHGMHQEGLAPAI